MTILLILGYCLSFIVFGLFFAVKAQRRNLFPKELLYIASIAISLASTYVLFFIYYLSVTAGHIALIAYLIASVAMLILLFRDLSQDKKFRKTVLVFFAIPLLLILAVLLIYSRLLYSCRIGSPVIDQWGEVQNPTYCYLAKSPIDNALPFIFAQNVFKHQSHSLVIDWSIADRPPLQIGAALPIVDVGKNLSQYNKYTAYNIFAIFLQLSWIGLMWGVFKQLIKKNSYIFGLLIGFASVGFFYINSIFVWPKLLSASLVAFGIYMLLNVNKSKKHMFDWNYVIFAAFAIALGLLAHQGVIFTVAAMVLMIIYEMLFKRKLYNFNRKEVVIAIVVAVALLAPWQIIVAHLTKSDRLVKWQFAGIISVSDKRGTLETVIQQYEKLTFSEWIKDKKANLDAIYNGFVKDPCPPGFTKLLDSCHMHSWRDHTFFSSFYAFEFYIFGFLIVIWQLFKRKLDRMDKTILIMSILSLTIWVILMYIPGSTILHQGSFAMMLLLFILLGKRLVTIPKYIFVALTVLQVTLFYFAWIRPFNIHLI